MFAHLDRICAAHPEGIRSDLINSLTFEGRPWKLAVQPGIRKPEELVAALTIHTTCMRHGAEAPYEDTVARDGVCGTSGVAPTAASPTTGRCMKRSSRRRRWPTSIRS